MKSCVKCGATDNLTKDHIIPKWIYKRSHFFHFGKNLGRENIQLLCQSCNLKKGGMIDCSTEIGREFWEHVQKEIGKALNHPL